MTLARALFGSGKTDWATPLDLFRVINRAFSFTLDVCATRANRTCAAYFSPEDDALRQRWTGTCWMNPPYGSTIGRWLRKAREESEAGATVVALVPARTDTAWWHDEAMQAHEIRLLRGRLTFGGATAPAPFPSALLVFRPFRTSTAPHVVAWNWRATTGVRLVPTGGAPDVDITTRIDHSRPMPRTLSGRMGR
jgi:phage N-6-adenine-methyltransferase